MRYFGRFALITLICLSISALEAQNPPATETISNKTAAMKKLPGFFPLYWDAKAGKLWLEIDKWNTEFLYLDSLPAGVGSNDIGLDRGQMGESRVVRFDRYGPKVLLVQVNYNFRAVGGSAAEQKSVQDAFANSVLWGSEVSAEEGDHVLVDATSLFLADVHSVVDVLKKTKQGTFHLEPARSAVYVPQTKNFPQNTEVEVLLTFVGDEPGNWVQEVTPNPKAISVREHHSFIQLPDGNYKPRVFDPRAGFYGINYMDFATPIGQPIVKRFIARHRLEKKDVTAAVSDPVKPITYYLDPGTPEPVRSALLEGARWWDQAFEAAGYRNAFRVEMLPEDADPMDVRYNVIEWVHRSTRGWSYGDGIVDPRTGEIIKGHVTLGSQRVRQDYMIFQGLLSPFQNGKPTDPRMLQTALARLRQLAAHEVGHTLGLQHNYLASTENRASVMDYPPPVVSLSPTGEIDLNGAYATGIGEWDKVTIQFGYSQFAPGTQEAAALNNILQNAKTRGLTFLTDQDARPAGSSHPQTHLWDSGKNAVDELGRVMQVRAAALRTFSETSIPEGTPMASLEDVLVPVYLYHRYQVEAASKLIGGQWYSYALRGDGQTPTAPIPADEQRRALKAVLQTLSPENLLVPESIAKLIPPHPEGVARTRESFQSHTWMNFDRYAPAMSAAEIILPLLLDPDRANRLIEQHDRDAKQPGLVEVFDALISATWRASMKGGELAGIQRAVNEVTLNQLLVLAQNEKASAQVRAVALLKLKQLQGWATMQAPLTSDELRKAQLSYAALQIRKFEQEPAQSLKPTELMEIPPGAPIGSAQMSGGWFDGDVE